MKHIITLIDTMGNLFSFQTKCSRCGSTDGKDELCLEHDVLTHSQEVCYICGRTKCTQLTLLELPDESSKSVNI